MQHAKTLAWEFWARSWRETLMSIAGGIAFPALIYGLLLFDGALPTQRQNEVWTGMHFGLFWYVVFLIAIPIMLSVANPQHRYKLPVSSVMMVAVPMFCAMVTTFGMYVIVATTLNILFHSGWLIWAPGLFAITTVAWYLALLLATSNSLGLQLLVGLASTLGTIWIAVSNGGPERPLLLQDLTPLRVATFLLVIGISLGIGTLGVSRLRSGDAIPTERLIDWFSSRLPRSKRQTAFPSPTAAQLWFEWAGRGYVITLITAVIGAAAVFFIYCFATEDSNEIVAGATPLFVLLGVVSGLYLGARSQNGEVGNFMGSRPLTDSQLGNAVLKNVAMSLLISVLIWLAFTAILLQLTGRWNADLLAWTVWLLATIVWATAAIVVSAITAALTIAGKRVLVIGVWLSFGTVILGFVINIFMPSFVPLYFCGTSFVLIAAILGGFVQAYRLRLIGIRTVVFSLISICLVLGALITLGPGWSSPVDYLAATSIVCCIPTPLAAAPLAVWWNRHR